MRWVRRAEDFPFFHNDGKPLAFAHRGGARLADRIGLENSMSAFAAAVEMGFRYVETDVHATKDGVLLAFHDAGLARMTGRPGLVADLTYDDLASTLLGGREAIPSLAEVLTTWPGLKVNVDCKSRSAIRPLAGVIGQQHAEDRVCLASFSPWRLSRLRAAVGPRVATSYTAVGVATLRFTPGHGVRTALLGHRGQAAQVPRRAGPIQVVTREFVDRAHEVGKHVHVWTVDRRSDMHQLLDLGVDGIMTDRCDVLRDVYLDRGIWSGASGG